MAPFNHQLDSFVVLMVKGRCIDRPAFEFALKSGYGNLLPSSGCRNPVIWIFHQHIGSVMHLWWWFHLVIQMRWMSMVRDWILTGFRNRLGCRCRRRCRTPKRKTKTGWTFWFWRNSIRHHVGMMFHHSCAGLVGSDGNWVQQPVSYAQRSKGTTHSFFEWL